MGRKDKVEAIYVFSHQFPVTVQSFVVESMSILIGRHLNINKSLDLWLDIHMYININILVYTIYESFLLGLCGQQKKECVHEIRWSTK